MKHDILKSIYSTFEDWSTKNGQNGVCRKGCSTCCSQNVTLTAIEAENILRFIIDKDMVNEFAKSFQGLGEINRPKLTTNDFAKACLDGRDVDLDVTTNTDPCPFLKSDICTIYPVRPFSCRLFISSETCKTGSPAKVSNEYLEASTAVTQVIEHLGQKEYWGNMLDVLPALLDISEFKEIAKKFNTTFSMQARMRTLTAKPLPGFLLSEEEGPKVAELLERIFDTEVQGKRIEDILNGR